MLLSLFLTLLPQTAPPILERPRDPWVFRSVLDGRARMVTIALSPELWVAYDAAHCGFYRAWKGGVLFEGAVYTSEHGPQPSVRGATYAQGMPSDRWRAEVDGAPVAVEPAWRGYELAGGRAILHYDLVLADGRAIAIRESPEFVRPPDRPAANRILDRDQHPASIPPSAPGFVRRFTSLGIPPGVRLSLRIDDQEALGRLQEPPLPERAGVRRAADELREVELTVEHPSCEVTLFFAPRELPPEVDVQADGAREPEAAK
jgi:hypothetical protein